ncbi:hypothetical protein [Streptococcus pluranimalium]
MFENPYSQVNQSITYTVNDEITFIEIPLVLTFPVETMAKGISTTGVLKESSDRIEKAIPITVDLTAIKEGEEISSLSNVVNQIELTDYLSEEDLPTYIVLEHMEFFHSTLLHQIKMTIKLMFKLILQLLPLREIEPDIMKKERRLI